MKVSFYKNYDCGMERITGESEWKTSPMELIAFMGTFSDGGGIENEAIEIGLLQAVKDI